MLVQLLPDSPVQFLQREELPVPQSSDDPSRYNTNGTFRTALVLWLTDSGWNYSSVVMLCQFSVGAVDLGRIPVSSVVYTGLEVVRYQHDSRAAKILEHIDMDMDPVRHIHPQTAFCVGIHAEGQNANKQVDGNCFSGVPVNDVQLVSSPVHLDPVTGLSGDMHSCTLFFCKLLEVIAELRVHEGLFAQLTALLAVLHPEQLERYTAPGQLFGYFLKVWHSVQGYLFLLLWKQQPLQVCVRLDIQQPGEIGCTGPLQNGCNGISGTPTALCDAPLTDPLAMKPEDLTILGHMMTSL